MKSNIFIEIIKERQNGIITKSDIAIPSETDIQYFKSRPCDHVNCTKQLIYDEHGFEYDERYCAVCGCSLGYV